MSPLMSSEELQNAVKALDKCLESGQSHFDNAILSNDDMCLLQTALKLCDDALGIITVHLDDLWPRESEVRRLMSDIFEKARCPDDAEEALFWAEERECELEELERAYELGQFE